MRKKEILGLVRSMSMCEGAMIGVRVDFMLSDEFKVIIIIIGDEPRSVLSPFLFAVVVDIVTELAREGVLSELLFADDLVLMS